MLSHEALEVKARQMPGGFEFVRLCAHCAEFLTDNEICDCSGAGMVYDPRTREFSVPLPGDPIDRLVVEREQAQHGWGAIEVGGIEDEEPGVRQRVKRRTGKGRCTRHRSETSIQDDCKKTLMLHGYTVVTTASKYMQTGTPDLLGCVNGRMVAIEVKRVGEKPRPDQMGELNRWQTAGALVGWACDEEDVRDLLHHVDDRGWINPLAGPGDGRRA